LLGSTSVAAAATSSVTAGTEAEMSTAVAFSPPLRDVLGDLTAEADADEAEADLFPVFVEVGDLLLPVSLFAVDVTVLAEAAEATATSALGAISTAATGATDALGSILATDEYDSWGTGVLTDVTWPRTAPASGGKASRPIGAA